MSSFVPNLNPINQTQSKRYPYARPRRATSKPTPKAALVGDAGARFPLQAKKRGHNFSLGSQQVPRIVSTAKSTQQSGPVSQQDSNTSAITNPYHHQASPPRSTAYIPVKLPRVKIPLVDPRAFCYGRLADVPPDYVASQLRIMSPSMLRSAALYRPVPPPPNNATGTHPSSPSEMETSSTPDVMDILPSDTLRFEVPADVARGTPTLSALYGLEPTHCLAVRPRMRLDGRTAKTEGPFGSSASDSEEVGRMIPIHHMVYASQCANYPRPVDYAPEGPRSELVSPVSATGSMMSPLPSVTSLSIPSSSTHVTVLNEPERATTPKASSSRAPLPPIDEEISTPPARQRDSDVRDETTPTARQRPPPIGLPETSSASFTSMQLDEPDRTQNLAPLLAQVVDLPMVHVTVPHPSGMALIHGWLYNPSPPVLLATLLALPRPVRAVPAMPPVSERLAALPVPALLERMQKIHKLWSNVVALGISDPVLWKVMDRAWDTLVATVKQRGGEAVQEVPVADFERDDEGMGVHSEVVRKFSMATIRDPRSRGGSVDTLTS